MIKLTVTTVAVVMGLRSFSLCCTAPDCGCDVANCGGLEPTYGNTTITYNSPVELSLVQNAPTVRMTVPDCSGVSAGSNLLLVMVDPDAPSDDDCSYWLHWLTGATYTGQDVVDPDDNQLAMAYGPPSPPEGSEYHRYQLLVYALTDNYTIPNPDERSGFDLQTEISGLGSPIATTQFLAQNQ